MLFVLKIRSGQLALVFLTLAAPLPAQIELDVGEVVGAAQEWVKDNVDEDVLRALPELDRKQVERFLQQFQDQLKADQVLDVAALKDAAGAVLPLLEAHDETKPYAVWLRSRLDYLEVSEEMCKTAPLPKVVPGQPPSPRPNPSADTEQKVWQEQLSRRDWPKCATELVPKLKPIFAAELVPEQLVWVAEVESSFNPEARSPVGAAGLFQLMPETAESLGLHRWPSDQRYQPLPSAQAAARYLKRLHAQFGDWRLALAAYNGGEGRVRGLLQRNSGPRSFEAIATRLPAETQMFVPKVEATILRREGVSLADLKTPEP
jgi:membrane-bound lytic murein transglycosylase D